MPTYTACCFGGPLDRQIRAHDGREFRVALARRMSTWLTEAANPEDAVSFKTKVYKYEVIAFPGPEYVGAWVYEDGWIEDETVRNHIVMELKVMWWLARAWNGR